MALLGQLTAPHGDRMRAYVSDQGTRNAFSALPIAEGTQVYACGPTRMLEALQHASAGWPDDALTVEHFASTIGTLDPDKEHAFEAELKNSGLVVTVAADQTLLAALRKANIDVPSDCEVDPRAAYAASNQSWRSQWQAP